MKQATSRLTWEPILVTGPSSVPLKGVERVLSPKVTYRLIFLFTQGRNRMNVMCAESSIPDLVVWRFISVLIQARNLSHVKFAAKASQRTVIWRPIWGFTRERSPLDVNSQDAGNLSRLKAIWLTISASTLTCAPTNASYAIVHLCVQALWKCIWNATTRIRLPRPQISQR